MNIGIDLLYEQYIEKLRPKPEFNLDYYKNDDRYSDGDVENQIVRIIAENEPEQYTEAISRDYSWPVYYHLTRTRRNILNWYQFEPDSDVLEIGCGFGAITGMLCDSCRSVTSVELSKRRAMGTLLRCRQKDNLEIIVGNLNDIAFQKRYDYITLIGVLEYQGRFTESDNPYRDFLSRIKQLLKPDGKLIIAIENQYGLKYWCGAREDHTGVPFDGMNQYIYTNQGIRTFSKEGLKELIKSAGYDNTYFYYPMPDYKFPTVVYSENYLPDNSNMQNVKYYYSKGYKSVVADEKRIYSDIIDNGVFEFFANSFLVECSQAEDIGKTVFASICDDRIEDYQIATLISGDKSVYKTALSDKGMVHIMQTAGNEAELSARGLSTLGSVYTGGRLDVPYSDEESFEELFVRICMTGDEDAVIYQVERLYEEILKSSDMVSKEDNILYALDPKLRDNGVDYGFILKKGYIDMTFRNAFVRGDKLVWFDQEWVLENVPADYIIYRALGTVYFSNPQINDMIPIERIIEKCGLRAEWDSFSRIEQLFSASVRDELHLREKSVYELLDDGIIAGNIKKLM